MSETLIILITAISIGLFQDARKPKQYALELENGKSEHILIENNGKYACPTYCATDHLHTAMMCSDNCNADEGAYQIHTSTQPNLGISFNGQTVLAMERVQTSKGKVKTSMASK